MTITLRVGIGLILGFLFWGLMGSFLLDAIHAQKPTPTPSGRVIRPNPTPISTPKPVPPNKGTAGKGVKSGSGGRRVEPTPPSQGRPPQMALTPQIIVEPEMVFIRGGTFKMGSLESTGDSDEHPQRDVTVPSFYMGKFEITQAQWKAVMGAEKNPSYFKGDNLPVENVSWNDAKEFCQKLSQLTGKTYRLPTESEWEYACRAGTTGDYAGKLDEMGWYGDNSGNNRIDSLKLWNDLGKDLTKYSESVTKNGNQTHPVGKKTSNPWGLFDMHGNVWEWCEDVWHDSYKDAPKDGSAWLSGGKSNFRVVRGGSWYNYGYVCRSAARYYDDPGFHYYNVGFRVVVAARSS